MQELPDNSLFVQLQDSMICVDFVASLLEHMTEPSQFLLFCPMLMSLLHNRGDYCETRIKVVALVSSYADTFIMWLDPEFSCASVSVPSLQWAVVKLMRILVVSNNFENDLEFHIKILFRFMISKPRSDMIHSYVTEIVCHILSEVPLAKSIKFRCAVMEFLVEHLLLEPYSLNSVEKPYLAHLRMLLDIMFNEYHEIVQMRSFVSDDLWKKLHITESIHFPSPCK
uniref:Uncharacterized protein n=1 Tax=Vannella robusta TaxID=1487602 RepID=A0A7S4MGW6_9EUKA